MLIEVRVNIFDGLLTYVCRDINANALDMSGQLLVEQQRCCRLIYMQLADFSTLTRLARSCDVTYQGPFSPCGCRSHHVVATRNYTRRRIRITITGCPNTDHNSVSSLGLFP